MDIKKIVIKKSESNLTGLVIALILVIGIFTGMYLYLNQKIKDNNLVMDSKYNDTYNNLQESQTDIDTNIQSIKASFQNVTEAPSVYQVAVNGFKGLGYVMKLPITFVDSALKVSNAMFRSVDVIPRWITMLAIIGLTTFIVLLVIAILKGDPGRV